MQQLLARLAELEQRLSALHSSQVHNHTLLSPPRSRTRRPCCSQLFFFFFLPFAFSACIRRWVGLQWHAGRGTDGGEGGAGPEDGGAREAAQGPPAVAGQPAPATRAAPKQKAHAARQKGETAHRQRTQTTDTDNGQKEWRQRTKRRGGGLPGERWFCEGRGVREGRGGVLRSSCCKLRSRVGVLEGRGLKQERGIELKRLQHGAAARIKARC